MEAACVGISYPRTRRERQDGIISPHFNAEELHWSHLRIFTQLNERKKNREKKKRRGNP